MLWNKVHLSYWRCLSESYFNHVHKSSKVLCHLFCPFVLVCWWPMNCRDKGGLQIPYLFHSAGKIFPSWFLMTASPFVLSSSPLKCSCWRRPLDYTDEMQMPHLDHQTQNYYQKTILKSSILTCFLDYCFLKFHSWFCFEITDTTLQAARNQRQPDRST